MHNLRGLSFCHAAAFGVAFSCALAFRDINRTAGLLFIPYVAFLAYTNCLNFVLGKMNPGEYYLSMADHICMSLSSLQALPQSMLL